MTTVAIFGATSGIAKECARQWVSAGVTRFHLVGRDRDALEVVSHDLSARNSDVVVLTHVGDLTSWQDISRMSAEIQAHEVPDIVLIAQGTLPAQELVQRDLSALSQSLEINAISPVMCAEACVNVMQATGGTIAVIGSVAGDRGRQSNYSYGAAKALVDTYVRGMQHRLFSSKLNMLLIKPGPVNTPMTAGLGLKPGALAPVSTVARDIIRAIEKKKSVVYTPAKWGLIMAVVRAVPSGIFNRSSL